jgi:hypothetical protein
MGKTPTSIGHSSAHIGNRVPKGRPAGFLPPAVAKQSVICQKAFILLCAKPNRSLKSLAKEVGCAPVTLQIAARTADWTTQLALVFSRDAESLHEHAKHESQRSRAELLASNALNEGALQAALEQMTEVDEFGKVKLTPGYGILDIARLQQARMAHVKTTQIITGEEAAIRRGVAVAGAPKVVIDMKGVRPEPVPVSGEIVEERR